MAHIVFLTHPVAASLNPSFALARKLQRRGHQITYVVRLESEARVRAEGFDFRPLMPDLLPLGSIQKVEDEGTIKAWVREYKRILQGLAEGGLKRALEGLSPDLFLVDSFAAEYGVAAHAFGKPLLVLNGQLLSVKSAEVPPQGTSLVPDGSLGFKVRNRLQWTFRDVAKLGYRFLLMDIHAELARLAKQTGFPVERLDMDGEFTPRLRVPELVACPRDFDFPGDVPREDVFYVEPLVDLERQAAPLDLKGLAEDKPLVYGSVGTLALKMYGHAARPLLQTMLDALGQRPQWQGVVSLGAGGKPEEFRVPPNVIALPSVPQLEVLKRASLVLTHAGINTLKECFAFGVPVVALPLFNDQPGNAARVVYHRLGVRARNPSAPQKLTPAELVGMMETVMADAGYRERARAMGAVLAEAERRGPALDIIERHLPRA